MHWSSVHEDDSSRPGGGGTEASHTQQILIIHSSRQCSAPYWPSPAVCNIINTTHYVIHPREARYNNVKIKQSQGLPNVRHGLLY